MWREILISQMGNEVLIAVVEDHRLVEFHTDEARPDTLLGNIYKGRVKRILQGMDAAFIDIGETTDGFLYVSDLRSNWMQWTVGLANGAVPRVRTAVSRRILDYLREGDELIVQIKREPIDHKAPRVSTKIAITGTYLVYTPTGYHIGVSSRISDPARRSYLKRLGRAWVGREGGVIFRTASQNVTDDILEHEWKELYARWRSILSRAQEAPAPRLLYREPPATFRLVRDLLTPSLQKIRVDHPGLFESLQRELKEHHPEWVHKLELYDEPRPLFYHYQIHREIHRLLKPKVWLKSGAYLVINQTEALVTIDVNTGKNVGLSNFQDSVFQVNLEAVKEIVRQIRLRNLSGLILIDFIDMELPENLVRLRETLENELKRDRARTCILPQSGKSLMLLTRQKMQASLVRQLTVGCPHCQGRGFAKSPRIIAWEILWKLSQIQKGLFDKAMVRAHPEVVGLMRDRYRERLQQICKQLRTEIELREDGRLNPEMYDLTFS